MDFRDLNGPAAAPNRAVLKELNSGQTITSLSPSATKPMGAGGGGSSAKLTPLSRALHSPASTTAAGVNSALNQVDNELDEVRFDGGHLQMSFNNNAGVNLGARKFIGLTEYDESSIPELPGAHIDEHLNLTFEEDLIPTLTANVNTGFNSTIEKADNEINYKMQLLTANAAASKETDTAVSSDNETFSECQSFHDVLNSTNDLAHTSTNAAEMSEMEAYRSAINSYNNTTAAAAGAAHANINDDEQLNATMEDVAEIADEQHVLEEQIFSFVAGENEEDVDPLLQQHDDAVAAANETIGDEPMEVDMDIDLTIEVDDRKPEDVSSGSQDVASGAINFPNATAALLHSAYENGTVDSLYAALYSQHRANNLQDVASGSQHVANPAPGNLGDLLKLVKAERLTRAVPPARSDTTNNAQPAPATRHLQMQQSIQALLMDRSRTYSSDKSVIQDNSIDSASDAFPELSIAAAHDEDEVDAADNNDIIPESAANQAAASQAIIEHDLAEQISSTATLVEEAPKETPKEAPKETPKEAAKVDAFPKAMTATFTKIQHHVPLSLPHAAASTAMDAKQNLTLEMNTSFSSAKSSGANSPSFPLREPKSVHYFPHSPTARPEKPQKETFLEKSENAERINEAEKIRKISITQKLQQQQQQQVVAAAAIKITPASPENNSAEQAAEASKLNETSENAMVITRARSSSPQSIAAVLNGTFDGSAAPPSLSANDKRLTFNVAETPSPTTEVQIEFPASADRRRTFNLSESTLTAHLNVSCEPMDLDTTTSNTMATSPTPKSPPIPTLRNRPIEETTVEVIVEPRPSSSPPVPTLQQRPVEIFEVPPQAEAHSNSPLLHRRHPLSPPLPALQKRPDIEPASPAASPTPSSNDDPFSDPIAMEILSAKEKTSSDASDEKDVNFVSRHSAALSSPLGGIFSSPSELFNEFASSGDPMQQFTDADFQTNGNLILNTCDFDYLLTKGNNNVQVDRRDRSSLLLRFDPLLGVSVPVNQPQQQQQQLLQLLANTSSSSNNNNAAAANTTIAAAACLTPTIEEDEPCNRSFVVEAETTAAAAAANCTNSAKSKERSAQAAEQFAAQEKQQQAEQNQLQRLQQAAKAKKNVRMSVEVIKDMNIDNDCKKSFENSNSQSDEKQSNFKMDELEKKIKNEVLKTEDIEKKLKEAEQREEALIKRITEKDKTISKMNGVIEAYEKAIAELISEKEQLIQNYEQQMAEVKTDRDSNYHHLTSLETTFSDLHVKYEKSKEMTSQLKSSEESLLAEKRQNLENLRLQEQRYEKMKNHAMQQLEIANRKLESLTKEHAIESTKLKALLKKEEISRGSLNEQLAQKSRENSELVKICDELINGQGS